MSAKSAATVDRAAPPEETPLDWKSFRHLRVPLFDRLRRSRQLSVGLALLGSYLAVGIYAILAYGPNLVHLTLTPSLEFPIAPAAPSSQHYLGVLWISIGVDWVHTDLFTALVKATPIDLAVLGLTIGGALLLGLFLGGIAGYDPRGAGTAIVNASYILVSIPPFVLVLVLFFGVVGFVASADRLIVFGGLFVMVLWPYYAIPVQARARQVASEPYVEAARAAGANRREVLFRHILPNSVAPVLAQIPVDVYNILFVLTVFPFLGCLNPAFFGAPTPLPYTPYPEWGYLLATGACFTNSDILFNFGHWWMYTAPAAVVILFGIAVMLVCDGAEQMLRTSTGVP